MRILNLLFELGLSLLRAALRVSALKSGVTAQRAHGSQVWMPSTRVLWCYCDSHRSA